LQLSKFALCPGKRTSRERAALCVGDCSQLFFFTGEQQDGRERFGQENNRPADSIYCGITNTFQRRGLCFPEGIPAVVTDNFRFISTKNIFTFLIEKYLDKKKYYMLMPTKLKNLVGEEY
jgi:hypothetical protein